MPAVGISRLNVVLLVLAAAAFLAAAVPASADEWTLTPVVVV